MGDAIMATPALRALRQHYNDAHICFAASRLVKEVLSPSDYNDEWLILSGNPLSNAIKLREHRFTTVFLLKNSFSCAMSCMIAGIPKRIGYSRDARGWMLTSDIFPKRTKQGNYEPYPMMNYYLDILRSIGIDSADTKMHINVSKSDEEKICSKLPLAFSPEKRLFVIVPGGAFGPSKCWPTEKFAQLSDRLIEKYNANVVVSVAPNEAEIKIAQNICDKAKYHLINLAQTPLSMGELKALYANTDLVITNDTGPRHIAVALDRKVVSLFGPNDPAWTDSQHDKEIMIIAKGACVPCAKPVCAHPESFCMDSISVDQVLDAVDQLMQQAN